jgi:uncharacterized membrane protein YuzA (DUF378 family)
MSETKFIFGGSGNTWFRWDNIWINDSPEGWAAAADMSRLFLVLIKGIVAFLCFGLGAPVWGVIIGAMALVCLFCKGKISTIIDIIFVIIGVWAIYSLVCYSESEEYQKQTQKKKTTYYEQVEHAPMVLSETHTFICNSSYFNPLKQEYNEIS